MFDSVLNRGNVPKSRFGTGTAISIAVHAGLIGLTIYLTTRPPPIKEDFSEVKFLTAMPPPPPPPPPPKRRQEKQIVPKNNAFVQPKEIPREKPPEAEPQKEEPEEDEGEEGGVPGGVVGGVVGGVLGGVVGGAIGGTGTDVVPFGQGMTRPEFDKAQLTHNIYTREALEAQVQGMLIVKCNVLSDGTVRNCRIIKPLPHLGDAVVARLEQTRLTPATFQGKPISIDYVFNFNFTMPR